MTNKKHTIGFVYIQDVNNRRTWSGTPFYCKRSLATHFTIIDISPLDAGIVYFFRPYKVLLKKLFGINYHPEKKAVCAKAFARQVDRALRRHPEIEALFCMGTMPIAYLKSDIPIVSLSDSVYKDLIDYYPERKNILLSNIHESEMVEERGLQRADHLFFSSEWTCSYARKYHIEPGKVEFLPLGANLDHIPERSAVNDFIDKKIVSPVCNLLFIGVDWKRKGGDIAYRAFRYLRDEKRLLAKLTIIGCNPGIIDPDVTIHPFLDKNIAATHKIFTTILAESHFLLFPTRMECFGVVVLEANAFGVPCLGSDTGGVPSIIRNDVNGYLMDYDASPSLFAEKVFELFNNKDVYMRLCHTSRDIYEREMNWDATAGRISEKIAELVGKRK